MKHKKRFRLICLSLMALLLAAAVLLCTVGEPPILAVEGQARGNQEDYIKWVDFDVTYEALNQAMKLDISSHDSEHPLNWIEMLAYLGTKYGGDFSRYKEKDLNDIAERLTNGETMEEITKDSKYYSYYYEAYSAVLGEFLGTYEKEVPSESDPEKTEWKEQYGLKVFSPIAKTFPFNHYDDFGASRSYGFSRPHLGHDMMAATGTPVIAVESGIVEIMGWNQYGGWRVGIRSFDKKRYYYYAHLRKDRPFHADLKEGGVVKAGDVIGYVGRTGYSANENVNNIDESHLHIGLQLIFDESQKECNSEIWIDFYAISRLLQQNQSEVYRVAETKEFYRKYDFREPNLPDQTSS